jgi:hypothetical protein
MTALVKHFGRQDERQLHNHLDTTMLMSEHQFYQNLLVVLNLSIFIIPRTKQC